MIKILLGGLGSGKSVTAAKWISQTTDPVFTNMHIKNDNIIRLRYDMIIKTEPVEGSKVRFHKSVNWDFWNRAREQYKNFHIYGDEWQNVASARRSMSGNNLCISQWTSQLRKICGESQRTDFVVASQEISKIDVDTRDLAYLICYCQKYEFPELIPTVCLQAGKLAVKPVPKTYILNTFFTGVDCVNNYWDFKEQRAKTYAYRSYYLANPYFRLYDSFQILDFGESAYI
jgi:hypothetical protein